MTIYTVLPRLFFHGGGDPRSTDRGSTWRQPLGVMHAALGKPVGRAARVTAAEARPEAAQAFALT
jgi:hypothetical protein